jgi:hypothetical protein
MSEYLSGLAPELTGGGEKSFGENFEKKRWELRRWEPRASPHSWKAGLSRQRGVSAKL